MGRAIFHGLDHNKMCLMQIVAVYAALLSVFGAYHAVFSLNIKFSIVSLSLLGVVVGLELFLCVTKHTGRILLLFCIILGALAMFLREHVINGIAPYVNSYIEKRNEFYGISQSGMDVVSGMADDLVILIGVQLLLGMVLSIVLKKQKGGILTLLVMLIPVILAATVGYMPTTFSSWCLLSSGSLYLIMYHRSDEKIPVREITMAAGVLLMLYLCTLLIQPKIADYKDAHLMQYKRIRHEITESQNEHLKIESLLKERFEWKKESDSADTDRADKAGDYITGGIGAGNLDQLTKIAPEGTKELTVTVSERPTSRIYLKAYVGTTYTGTKWEELGSIEFSRLMSPFGTSTERRELMNEPFTRIADSSNRPDPLYLKVDLLNASRKYGYSPYYAEIGEGEEVKLDAYVKGTNSRTREYRFYLENTTEALGAGELAEASDLWESYNAFVTETYVEYPRDLKQLSEWCANLDPSTVESVGAGMDVYFSQHLRYSKEPGAKPSDQDFVEYFLFDHQKGFCVHFASAATLIYRECGYPARYVEGYVVSPENFRRQGDGTYQAVVTDEMAHAWCETFDEQTGWKVREHTLSYQDAEEEAVPIDDPVDDAGQEMQQEVTEPEEEQEIRKNEPPDTSNKNLAGESEEADGSKETAGFKENGWILGVILLLLCICLSAVIQQKIRRQKKLYLFRVRTDNRGIAAIYNEIYEICIFRGMKCDDQSDHKNILQMKERFPQLTEEEWEWMYECAIRAAFSSEKTERKDQKKYLELYRKFRKRILQELKGREKFWFLFVKAM